MVKVAVLFVCMGNICRSPTAEGVFRKLISTSSLAGKVDIDSAGTSGGHIGASPDPRAIEIAARRNYEIDHLRGRQVGPSDFERFDYIIAMDETNVRSIDEYIVKAFGHGEAALDGLGFPEARVKACRDALNDGADLSVAAGSDFPAWVSACLLRNTETYVGQLLEDQRYSLAKQEPPPLKLKRKLALFDCVNCNKCISVCPNNANIVLVIEPGTYPTERLVPTAEGWASEESVPLEFGKPWQIGNFVDACNECGNCEVICPELGNPCLVKPRFFGSVAAWREEPKRDGFALALAGDTLSMHGRFDGEEVLLEKISGGKVRYAGRGFDIRVDLDDPLKSVEGRAEGAVDLRRLRMMEMLRIAVTDAQASNFVKTALLLSEKTS